MDKASDFGSEDCRFESCHGRLLHVSHAMIRMSWMLELDDDDGGGGGGGGDDDGDPSLAT